jgi:hypothetical protein
MVFRRPSSRVAKAVSLFSLIGPAVGAVLWLFYGPAPAPAAKPKTSAPADLGEYYGFKPVEVFKL